jgi:hypothetical protein
MPPDVLLTRCRNFLDDLVEYRLEDVGDLSAKFRGDT